MDLDIWRYCPSVLQHLLGNIVVYMLLLKTQVFLMKLHLHNLATLSSLLFFISPFMIHMKLHQHS
jgi:hypothetical protein